MSRKVLSKLQGFPFQVKVSVCPLFYNNLLKCQCMATGYPEGFSSITTEFIYCNATFFLVVIVCPSIVIIIICKEFLLHLPETSRWIYCASGSCKCGNRNEYLKPVLGSFVGPLWLIPSSIKLIDGTSSLLQFNTSPGFAVDLNVLANINKGSSRLSDEIKILYRCKVYICSSIKMGVLKKYRHQIFLFLLI